MEISRLSPFFPYSKDPIEKNADSKKGPSLYEEEEATPDQENYNPVSSLDPFDLKIRIKNPEPDANAHKPEDTATRGCTVSNCDSCGCSGGSCPTCNTPCYC
ncbi:MAG: hypothetical protein ACHQUC_04555 [Chlamydiales bacterium]